jgi:ferritin-like protein
MELAKILNNLNQQLANTYISYKYYQIILSHIIKHSYNLCEQIKGTWSSELQIDELHEAWKHFDQPEIRTPDMFSGRGSHDRPALKRLSALE